VPRQARRPHPQRVTIREIAEMCGVSVQTVSRVINRRPDVAPQTRAAVEAAIAKVGFQPSAVARSLVQRRSNTLGVIAAGLRYFGVAQTLNGITDQSEASGYALLVKDLAAFETVDIVPVIDFLVAHRVEGIIFAAPEMETNVRSVQQQLPPGCPPIVFLKAQPSPDFTTIGIDNHAGGRKATEHLIALGRRRIAHLTGPLEWREARDRRDGWIDALRSAGLGAGPRFEGNWSSASGAAAFEQMLAVQPDLDGIFVGNDQMALGVLHVANERGIRVPDDLAVVGFDGMPEAAEFTPSLTTVNQPLGELGRLAVDELLAHVDAETGRAEARTIVLETDLIVRESAPLPPAAQATAGGRAAAPLPLSGPVEVRTRR
jgi:LacI family transcriptional regulator